MSFLVPGIFSKNIDLSLAKIGIYSDDPDTYASASFSSFLDTTNAEVDVELDLYFMNITNSLEVLQGEMYKLEMVGPYRFTTISYKQNYSFIENSEKFNYLQRTNHFVIQDSSGNEFKIDNDIIVGINNFWLTYSAHWDSYNLVLKQKINEAAELYGPSSMFNECTPKEWAFTGCTNNFQKATAHYKKGLLDNKTEEEVNQEQLFSGMYTGMSSTKDRQRTYMQNNELTSIWSTPNRTFYNDGFTSYQPSPLDEDEHIYFWDSNIQRNLKLDFIHKEDYNGVDVYKYRNSKDEYANSSYVEENFYFDQYDMPNGLFNMTRTSPGLAPKYFTPHLFAGFPELYEVYNPLLGLPQPDGEDDMGYRLIEPHAGLSYFTKMATMNVYAMEDPGWTDSYWEYRVAPVDWLPFMSVLASIRLSDDVVVIFRDQIFYVIYFFGILSLICCIGSCAVVTCSSIGMKRSLQDDALDAEEYFDGLSSTVGFYVEKPKAQREFAKLKSFREENRENEKDFPICPVQ